MNNASPLSPADRLVAILLALLQAVAARAGWLLPESLIAKIEGEIRGMGDALSQLLASIAEGKFAAEAAATTEIPAPTTQAGVRTRISHAPRKPGKRRHRGTVESPAEAKAATPAEVGHRPAAPLPPAAAARSPARSPHPPRPQWPKPQFSTRLKPAPWHALNVAIS